jgi:hypothetical protein
MDDVERGPEPSATPSSPNSKTFPTSRPNVKSPDGGSPRAAQGKWVTEGIPSVVVSSGVVPSRINDSIAGQTTTGASASITYRPRSSSIDYGLNAFSSPKMSDQGKQFTPLVTFILKYACAFVKDDMSKIRISKAFNAIASELRCRLNSIIKIFFITMVYVCSDSEEFKRVYSWLSLLLLSVLLNLSMTLLDSIIFNIIPFVPAVSTYYYFEDFFFRLHALNGPLVSPLIAIKSLDL